MSEFYDEIMASINETMESAKKKQLKETVFIKPVKQYNAEGVKEIRQSLHMTQAMFAGMIGVSRTSVFSNRHSPACSFTANEQAVVALLGQHEKLHFATLLIRVLL